MDDIINAFAGTPIPTILVVAGILFLLLSVAEKVSGRLTIRESRKKQAMVLGAVLLSVGVFLSLPTTNETADDGGPKPESAELQPLPGDDIPDWDNVAWTKMKPEHRELWEKLGHTAETWAGTAPDPATENMDFKDLSSDQQNAAKMLGYTAVKWDE